MIETMFTRPVHTYCHIGHHEIWVNKEEKRWSCVSCHQTIAYRAAWRVRAMQMGFEKLYTTTRKACQNWQEQNPEMMWAKLPDLEIEESAQRAISEYNTWRLLEETAAYYKKHSLTIQSWVKAI